ncbi:MAG TPA: hypothetical protein VFX42_10925 [Gemmatimonadales bacterium]|nr:hypothetical protein [Gemmatimonadales bacterium]
MKESAGTYALPTLCLTGPANQFLSLFLAPLQHPIRHGHTPSACGFHWSRQGCLRPRVVVTSEHSADVIPPSGVCDSLWSRVVVTPAAMVRLVSRVLGHRREPEA